jgi:hypothetical protein
LLASLLGLPREQCDPFALDAGLTIKEAVKSAEVRLVTLRSTCYFAAMNNWITSIAVHPANAAAGMVRTQAHMILVAIPQRTALSR